MAAIGAKRQGFWGEQLQIAQEAWDELVHGRSAPVRPDPSPVQSVGRISTYDNIGLLLAGVVCPVLFLGIVISATLTHGLGGCIIGLVVASLVVRLVAAWCVSAWPSFVVGAVIIAGMLSTAMSQG